jgi:hypothetical protein
MFFSTLRLRFESIVTLLFYAEKFLYLKNTRKHHYKMNRSVKKIIKPVFFHLKIVPEEVKEITAFEMKDGLLDFTRENLNGQ